ncbi:MAG: family 20 glycosylhydrolase [Acidobacteriia bacterium]|nr:family 20 glycosylhydrolase [Terriglobia bacterium]
MRILTLGCWAMACGCCLSAASGDLNLMPQPAHVIPGQGKLKIDQSFRVALTGYREPRLEQAAARLIEHLESKTGMPLSPELSGDAAGAALEISAAAASSPVQKLGEDESYRLEVTPAHARLTAPNPLGILRGMETFLQLVEADKDAFAVPALQIEDRPRFPWRGLMLDVARHWMPAGVVRRNLEAMAALKLNVLHWHLSDDQGFRVESKRFPKLHEMGSDGHYYTQQQVRDVIEFARERGIRVVPEFDMPGHTTAWFVGYPELASAPGPYTIESKWGIFDPAMDPTRDAVYQFLDAFIGEMAALFPDDYFHIGGDEVNGKQWERNPNIQVFIKQHDLRDNVALQAHFSSRLQPIVTGHGKKVIGWDEIFAPTLPKDIVVQSWRGQKSLADAAKAGYMGILSAGYYLDLMHSAEFHYAVDPIEKESAGLTAEQQARILGGEACMWSEYVTPASMDMRIWPRAAAIAERFWSPQEVKDAASMYRRLAVVSRDLEWRGVRHASSHHLMLERLADGHPVGPLATLSDVVEPVKEYSREEARQYTSFTPLNRLVDATRPESDVAREFGNLVDRALAGGSDASSSRDQLRRWLTGWRANDAALAPALEHSFLLQELIPLSKDLAALGSAGLEALDSLTTGHKPDAAWLEKQQALLDRAKKPRAELLLMVAPHVEKLVHAAGRL